MLRHCLPHIELCNKLKYNLFNTNGFITERCNEPLELFSTNSMGLFSTNLKIRIYAIVFQFIGSLDTIMLTSWAPHSLLFPCKEGAGRSTYLCPCPLDLTPIGTIENLVAQFFTDFSYISLVTDFSIIGNFLISEGRCHYHQK